MIAPDGNRQRVVEGVEQAGNALSGQTHRVEAGQRGQADLECRWPQVIARVALVLTDQADALKAHQIAVSLGRTHAGGGGNIFQHQRAAGLRQCFD